MRAGVSLAVIPFSEQRRERDGEIERGIEAAANTGLIVLSVCATMAVEKQACVSLAQ